MLIWVLCDIIYLVHASTLQLFSRVTHLIPLPSVCESYDNLHYHEGIIELVLSSAVQVDPQNLGLHYYKSNQPPGDVIGQRAFMERLKIYATITKILEKLLRDQLQPVAPSSAIPAQPGPPPAKPDKEELPNPRKEVDMIYFSFPVCRLPLMHTYITPVWWYGGIGTSLWWWTFTCDTLQLVYFRTHGTEAGWSK